MENFNVREAGEAAQREVVAEMAENNGKLKPIEWADEFRNGKITIAEMIGTDSGAREFIEKVTFDAYGGRETVPLLYKTIYKTITDPNFPKTLTAEEFGPLQCVFLKHLEGGEVKFGSMGPGTEKVVSFETYATGFEYNEDIVVYNQTWKVTEIGVALGEAYNHLLNHLHLFPIIDGTYVTTGGGLAGQNAKQNDKDDGAAQLIAFDTDIAKTLENALQVLPNGSILLINPFDRVALNQAIATDLNADGTPGIVQKGIKSQVEYDGVEIEVRNRTYSYGGVPQGFVFLIAPSKQNFVEYIKHDLRVDSDNADLSRLILDQVVGRARRAVLAGLNGKNGVVKVDIAS